MVGFFWLLQITGDQNSPDEGQIFRTVRLSFLAERSLFTHRAAPAPEVVFRCKTDRNYIKIKAMTEEKTEQAVEQAAAPETKKEEAPAVSLERTLELSVPSAQVRELAQKHLRGYAKDARMPGFRKGHVPMKQVEAMYGMRAFDEALNELVGQAWSKAAQASGLQIAGAPKVEAVEGANGDEETMRFTAKFEVFPEITYPDFKALNLKRYTSTVDDAAVEETINVMRKQRVTYTEAAADRAAQKDDRVTVNFTGTKEGIEFPGGKAEGFQFVIGSGRMLAEFDAAVAGMKAGESKTFDLTFPKEYGPADLNGATVLFLVEVTKVEEPHFPTIDDEFAQSLGVKDGVAAMRADVKKNLEREVSYRLEQRTAAEVFSALDKVLTFPVPAAVVEEERRAMAQQYAQAMRSRGLEAPKDIPDSMFQEPAVKKARVGLFISEVVQREKLTATDEQITARAQSIAASYENPAEVVQYLTTDRQSRVNVAMQVQEENVTNWLLGQATTEEVPVEFDKVMKGEF